MADFNSAGVTALGQQLANFPFIAWLDIAGGAIRVTNGPQPLIFAAGATGDPDLDGHSFGRTDGLISVSEVQHQAGGSATVTAYLSGLPGVDDATIALLDNPANWRGRLARLWIAILDPATLALLAVGDFYTGYMMSPRTAGSRQAQTIALTIEGYLAYHAEASGRTYLDQSKFDSGDASAAATLAAASGATTLAQGAGGSGGGGSASGGVVNRVGADQYSVRNL